MEEIKRELGISIYNQVYNTANLITANINTFINGLLIKMSEKKHFAYYSKANILSISVGLSKDIENYKQQFKSYLDTLNKYFDENEEIENVKHVINQFVKTIKFNNKIKENDEITQIKDYITKIKNYENIIHDNTVKYKNTFGGKVKIQNIILSINIVLYALYEIEEINKKLYERLKKIYITQIEEINGEKAKQYVTKLFNEKDNTFIYNPCKEHKEKIYNAIKNKMINTSKVFLNEHLYS